MRLVAVAPLALALGACARHPAFPAAIPPAPSAPRVAYSLRTIEMRPGTGAVAEEGKCLYAHYTGWLTDGTRFDSSRDTSPDGRPRTPLPFAYGARMLIPGWDAGGMSGLRVGGVRRLLIPYQLAYGDRGRPPRIPARADLIFDVELMAVADTLPRTGAPPLRRRADFNPQCRPWTEVQPVR
jgi:peptidylprolyl isomerase